MKWIFQKGISLLECVLSLAIIASICMMAVRYYTVTHREMNVTHAISQIKRITKASYEWLQAQKQPDFSDNSEGNSISIDALTSNELLQKPIDTVDPWGGDISIAPGADASYIQITLTKLPQEACRNLTQQLDYINKSTTGNQCGDEKNNDFVGEF